MFRFVLQFLKATHKKGISDAMGIALEIPSFMRLFPPKKRRGRGMIGIVTVRGGTA